MNPALASGYGTENPATGTTAYRASDFAPGQEIDAWVSLAHDPVRATVWGVEGDAGIGWLIVRVIGRPTLDAYGTGEYVHIPADRCAPSKHVPSYLYLGRSVRGRKRAVTWVSCSCGWRDRANSGSRTAAEKLWRAHRKMP